MGEATILSPYVPKTEVGVIGVGDIRLNIACSC